MSNYTLRFIDGRNHYKLLHSEPRKHTWARLQKNAIKFADVPSARQYMKQKKFGESSYRLVKTAIPLTPLRTRTVRFKSLPKTHRLAVKEAAEGELMYDRQNKYNVNFYVRVETYKTADIKRLVEDVWEWCSELKTMNAKWPNNWKDQKAWARCIAKDRARVRKIMKAIPKEGAWPYVSYWAATMHHLQHVEIEKNGGVFVDNHGDGWHRIIASIELKLPTIDIVYPGADV